MKVKRLEQIEGYIREKKFCTYEELSKILDVSLSTVHRDMEELAGRGVIRKLHGGVVYDKKAEDTGELSLLPYEYGKDQIARRAAELVEDNDILLLGSGATVAHMIPHLKEKKNITVITNNFNVIAESLKYNFNVISIGGNFDRHVKSFVGTQSIKQLDLLNANKAFIGCNGITPNGISNVVDLEADIKKTMIRISSSTTVLAESRKFDAMSLYTICSFEEIDRLITDGLPSKPYRKLLQEQNVILDVVN